MHRVELKVRRQRFRGRCGRVPNAPCGVESTAQTAIRAPKIMVFLMHRVELKEALVVNEEIPIEKIVPNAPCGVERLDKV